MKRPEWYIRYQKASDEERVEMFQKATAAEISQASKYLGGLYNQRIRRATEKGLSYLLNKESTPLNYKDFSYKSTKQLLSKLLWHFHSETISPKTKIRYLREQEELQAARFGVSVETLHRTQADAWTLGSKIKEYAELKGDTIYLPEIVDLIYEEIENGKEDLDLENIQKSYRRYKKLLEDSDDR